MNNHIFITLLLYIVFFVTACQKKVEKILPKSERISASVYASGVIKSKHQYQVYATVNGLLQKILVKEGDAVAVGTPLFVIQNETSKLNAENAKIAADFAQLNVSGDKISEFKASLDIAKSKMLNDSVLLQRQRALWAQQIGSKLQLEQAELAYATSLNNYRSAIYRYNDLKKQLKFAAAQSEKQLSISNALAKDYVIKSQIAGRVYNLSKEVGEIVTAQMPLGVIGSSNEFVAELQIDEQDIVKIKEGQQVWLTMDSYKGETFEARITTINPLMNERTRTFLVESVFITPPAKLYPNLTCEANIVLSTKEKAITIPRAFLINDSTVTLENGVTKTIKTGLRDYQKVEVVSGLSVDEYIIKPK